MTTEVIWRELSCPLLGGGLCVQSQCMAATCGTGNVYNVYDKTEEKTVKTPKKTTEYYWEGWWIFKIEKEKTETTYIEEKIIRVHFCKKIVTSYIICTQHNNNTIGVKISVKDDDDWGDWEDEKTHEWIFKFYTPIDKTEEKLQELRETINRECIYDSLE